MMRSRWVTGIAVVSAVAVGGVGGALIGVPGLSGATPYPKSATPTAATNSKPSVRPGLKSPLLDAAAKALNLTTQQLITKLSDGKTTIADVAKQQNVNIDTVITAMTNADHDRISNIVNKPWPKFGAPGPGQRFKPVPAAPGAPGFRLGLGRLGALALDPVAKALGITPAELKTDLGKGETIAQIAKGKNLDVNTVINTLVGDANAQIDKAVAAHHLTTAQADKLKAAVKTEITNLVNNGFPKGPMGGFGFGRRGSLGGPQSGSKPPTS